MKLAQSRITAQGQISIPAEVRRRLGAAPGAVLDWEDEGDRIVVRRAGRYGSKEVHDVLFPELPRRRSLRELKEGIRRHLRARRARS